MAVLWETLNANNVTEDPLLQPQQPSNETEMTDSDEEEDNTSNPAVHFDTCVQNADGPALEFDIAPGEGQRPIIFF